MECESGHCGQAVRERGVEGAQGGRHEWQVWGHADFGPHFRTKPCHIHFDFPVSCWETHFCADTQSMRTHTHTHTNTHARAHTHALTHTCTHARKSRFGFGLCGREGVEHCASS